jgi:hypothetical protein
MELMFSDVVGLELEGDLAGVLRLDAMPECARDRLGKAAYVLEKGLDDFPRGAEPIRTILLQQHPTFDDMLAAEFAERLLRGQDLPQGAKAFAEYARLASEGIAPGEVPLERSIQGVYRALKALSGDDLTKPRANEAFQEGWRKLCGRVMEAAASEENPFKAPLLDGPDFERERTYLNRDQEVYRQDIERGERWTVRLPGGPPTASGLMLVNPKSLLFPQWSRQDRNAPTGDSYLFLAVQWAERYWVFSTDPVQRLSLKPLSEQLQAAEGKQAPESATKNPWFDGARFGHTMIAAPKGGARISDAAILKTVKNWTAAKTAGLRMAVPRGKGGLSWRGRLVVLVPLILLAVFFFWYRHRTDPRGLTYMDERGALSKGITLHVLSVGVSKYDNQNFNLDFADDDAIALASAFERLQGSPFEKVKCQCLIDKEATKENITIALAELELDAKKGDLVIVTIAGHGLCDMDNDFFFLPHDFNDQKPITLTGLPWNDFQKYLKRLKCAAVVFMDTCHSGRITERGARSAMAQEEFRRAVTGALDDFANVSSGIVMIAAAASEESARESGTWKHGAMSLAVLEVLAGTHICTTSTETSLPFRDNPDQIVSLDELNTYVAHRVKELVHGRQSVCSNTTGNMPLDRIPIMVTTALEPSALAQGSE